MRKLKKMRMEKLERTAQFWRKLRGSWCLRREIPATRRGDTMIEVLLASAIFGFISILTIGLMNRGLLISQANLQLTMARNEVTAQSEALHFIHNAYTNSSAAGDEVSALWDALVDGAQDSPTEIADGLSCSEIYATDGTGKVDSNAFILNTYALEVGGDSSAVVVHKGVSIPSRLEETATFPYVDFADDGSVNGAYGIWVEAVKGGNINATSGEPTYYEFYIHTCWESLATEAPTTLDTVVRLYNPGYWT